MRHFKTRYLAQKYLEDSMSPTTLKIFKKKKGHRNRVKNPYVVCTYIEWSNLY